VRFGFGRSESHGGVSGWEGELRRAADQLQDAGRVVDFVLTGDSPQVLQRLGHRLLAAGTESPEFYAGFADRDPAVLRRWGQVLDAAILQRGWGLGWGTVGGHHWPEILLAGMQRALPADADPPLTLAHLAAAMAPDGADLADLLSAALAAPRHSYYGTGEAASRMLVRLAGYGEAMQAHAELVSRTISSGSVEQRVMALALVAELPDNLLPAFASPITQAAAGSNARVREPAQLMLRRFGDAALTTLRTLAVAGNPDERGRALELLCSAFDDRAFAEQTAAADRAASVRALPASWRAAAQARDEPAMEVPLPIITWGVPAAEADRIVDAVMVAHRTGGAPQLASGLRRTLTSSTPPVVDVSSVIPDWKLRMGLLSQLNALAGSGRLTAPAAVSVLVGFGVMNKTAVSTGLYQEWQVLEAVHDGTGSPDLLSLQVMFDECGLPGAELVWHSYARLGLALGRHWPSEHVWPFVARNLDLLIQHSRSGQNEHWFDDTAFVAALKTLPRKPSRVLDLLYERALGSRKSERQPAQEALADDLRRVERAVAALGDGKADIRVSAARWLARIADPATQPALEKAFFKEKQDVAEAAILDALEALGRPVEDYLDAGTLRADAEKAAGKGWPRDLEWFPWEVLPSVHWSATNELVAPVVVQHLVAQAVRAKSAEPNAILRKHAGLMVEPERQELAKVVLELWLAEDTRPRPRAEAENAALRQAQSMHMWSSQPGGMYAGLTVEEVAAKFLPELLRQPAGSATASKGILAVVAAFGGVEVVAPTDRYLRDWYGMRAAQCKSLMAMLAWVEHPAATQLLLAVGNRFRTKGIQEEASRQVQALADRRGWTLAELADRTVPTVGFNDDGRRSFDYGTGRSFTARLLPDVTIELRDDSGAVVKTLPPPRKTDNADAAAAAKKAFAAAKKELKTVAALQAARLHEALYIGRGWTASDWMTYLAGHPVSRLLVGRLVWIAMLDGRAVTSFRLLEDGTLTNADDAPVECDPGWEIQLAHDSNLAIEDSQRWLEHLADYEVKPLFPQLGRELLSVSETQHHDLRIEDLQGHLLSAYALRGRAGKLGWTRGPAADGGWFYSYTKRFATSGVTAIIEFTGNPLPEQDRTVALRSVGFEQDVREGFRRPLPLGEVPAVLLSETWHELREIAAMGSGFDADWEKKTEF
jgi:Domain of unknown function (DUF4132)